MNVLRTFIESLGLTHPVTFLLLFLIASLLMLWRLEAMMRQGLEGTALGTLVMPYCSGLGNLIFVGLMLHNRGPAREVLTNCLVNNVTNLTLLLGLPALAWGLDVLPSRAAASESPRRKKSSVIKAGSGRGGGDTTQRLSRLSLLLTMAAVLFFTGITWILGRDGRLDRTDGLVLTGLFLFWQCFQVFDVMKHNVRQNRSFGPGFYLDLALVLLGAWVLYESLDWLVTWLAQLPGQGFLSARNLGWLSGWLMVLPNAVLAIFYGWRRRADVVYSSQIGDGHICIPLCLGIYAMLQPMPVPAEIFVPAMWILIGATTLHFFCVAVLGRLPPWAGTLLIATYAWFVAASLLN